MTDITERLRDLANHNISAADRHEAAAEIERWRTAAFGDDDAKTSIITDLSAKLAAQTAANRSLLKALQFYADRDNWLDKQVDYGGNYTDVAYSAPAADGGKTARSALKDLGSV
jgi:hypothetical protein